MTKLSKLVAFPEIKLTAVLTCAGVARAMEAEKINMIEDLS